ncbi:sodium:proton antiporter [Pseudoxanthomonas kalamensis DSM 18571]|uniref:cation:proton antiporter n=1 Tax=Pseudoxanthomonas kalamensis TaxID=289483 RepID=UPI0013912B4F|nr:sodium:proton antiporter [Pseudoxanthomonas kalamensis]KAF1709377.1 sodium:proton antiporter [Pseudoxanthomonas kalamensis DSM 18571]
MFDIAVVCLVVTALLAYLNHRFIGLPTTIGVMAVALLLSLGLIGLDHLGFGALHDYEAGLLQSIDFAEVLMQGMLSMLLFAGAMHINLGQLRDYRWQVGTLAVLGTALSTLIVGFGLYWLLPWLGFELSLGYCLVFGALISPTDPIAVLALLRSAGAPDTVRLVVSGESLFNDGVGVVLFSLLLTMAAQGEAPTLSEGAILLTHEAGGGLLLGAALGAVLFYLLRSIDNYKVEVLLTLAGVLGGYELAHSLHVSGPLAMVVAGLIVGNHGRAYAMSDTTRQNVDMFWELLDEILNAVLFVLLGLEIVMVQFNAPILLASAAAIAIALLARFLAVGLPIAKLSKAFRLPDGAWKILTWGGLRGGISVALVLSLPAGPQRDQLLAMTYAVVVFSILVQGTTIKPMIRRILATNTGSQAR